MGYSSAIIKDEITPLTGPAAAESLQSCPTLCDPIDGSPPGSPTPGILYAWTLEWAAISFSNAWQWKVKVKSFSRVWLFVTPWTAAYEAPPSMGFSRQEYWSGVPLPSPPCPYSLREFNLLYCNSFVLIVNKLYRLSWAWVPGKNKRLEKCLLCSH